MAFLPGKKGWWGKVATIKKYLGRKELAYRELISILVAVNLVVLLSLILPAPLKGKISGAEIVPAPWMFAGVQNLLKYLPPFWAGVFMPCALILILILFPFIEKIQPFIARVVLWSGIILSVIITIIGVLSMS